MEESAKIRDKPRVKKTRKLDTSKRIALVTFWGGMLIIEECLLLMWYAIHNGFTATAAYLTAAVGVAEGMITLVARKYLSLAQADHSSGGITFESAKSKNFKQSDDALDAPDL